MSIPQLLHTMCAELSDADLNAIRKARGFSAKETASRTAFASFYLTSVGLAEVMHNLEPTEAVTLRLLHETGLVDISFFDRLYGSAGSHYNTYTQQYKSTLAEVKAKLVRRGLVVMAEVKTRAETVQMERWRFALPPEFAPYLPPLPGKQIDNPGQQNDTSVRRKLLELVGGGPAIPNDPQPIHLQNGSIYLENSLFSQATFSIWQGRAWERAARVFKPNVPASLSPTQAAIQLLDDQTWRSPKDLEAGILIYSFGCKDISVETLLKQGWELGLLSRLDVDHTPHYRLAPTHPAGTNDPYPATLNWADTTSKPGSVKVDLRLISIHDLDLLNILTHLAVENGVLLASPSLVKLGRATPAQRRAPLSRWLAESVPAFAKTLETVESKWGKTLLHENLLIAHVRDLSLRVQLERALGRYLIVLNDHHIAFPPAWRSEVEKVLKKAGFVVKTVKA
jgi:hypothetical protein